MTGIYYITNKINNKRYIGSSIDVQKRLSTHFSRLRNNNHPNKYLQSAVIKYGLDNFEGRLIEECEVEDLLTVEQDHINNYFPDQLYNLTFITGAGGYDILSKQCYLLDLKGNIKSEFNSIMDCSRALDIKFSTNRLLNQDSIINKKYRLVTKEFYNGNLKEILSWKNYSNKYIEDLKNNKLKRILLITDNNEELKYNTIQELSEYLNITQERIRQMIVSNKFSKKWKKYNIRYAYPELQVNI